MPSRPLRSSTSSAPPRPRTTRHQAGARPEKKPAPIAAATDALPELVAALKAWRKQRANADSVPAFVVLSDTHLAGIATSAPTSLDELARCAGIGPTKLERYGDEILAVIADLGT